MNRAYRVINRDPAPVLPPAAHLTSQPEPERQKNFLQRASPRAEDDAEAEIDHAYAGLGRGRGFPFAGHGGEKAVPSGLSSVRTSSPRLP
jgi:hypothetical protein